MRWYGLGPASSPGFKLAGFRNESLRGMEEELAKISAQEAALNAAGGGGGGVADLVRGIFGQGAAAGQNFVSSLTALQAGEAARERARTMKLVGGVVGATAIIGLGLWGLSKLSKR